jgi:hypothetical protein
MLAIIACPLALMITAASLAASVIIYQELALGVVRA